MAEFILEAHIEFSEHACSKISFVVGSNKILLFIKVVFCFVFCARDQLLFPKKLPFPAKNNTFPFDDPIRF